MVRVRFHRRTAVIGDDATSPQAYLQQTGEATFEPASGRFTRLSFTETREEAFGGGSGAAVWVYDPARSRERAARRGSGRTSAAEYDAWIAANGARAEIAATVAALADPVAVAPELAFQLHAHPADLWTAVIDRPEAGPRLVSDEQVVAASSAGPPDDVVAVLRARWAEAAFAQPLLARIADERLRPELRRLAAGRGAVATEARLTLQALDLAARPRVEAFRPLAAFPARLRAVWSRLSARGADPSPLVPVMIALASTPGAPAEVGVVCAEVARAAGFPGAGEDRREIRQWWSTEGARPWADRLVDAVRAAPPDRRAATLALLARGPDSPAVRDALAAAQDDPANELVAAVGLAARHDGRAVPALVAALGDPAQAAVALEALGHFADTTLGFDPAAPPDDSDRTAALSRFREWLRRR
jgi:hypothetical protein